MFFQYYFQKTSRLVDGQSGSVLESLGSECGSERGGGADERTHVMCVVAWLLAGWREGEEVISLVSEREGACHTETVVGVLTGYVYQWSRILHPLGPNPFSIWSLNELASGRFSVIIEAIFRFYRNLYFGRGRCPTMCIKLSL